MIMNVVKSMFEIAYSLLESDLTQYTSTHHLLETTDYCNNVIIIIIINDSIYPAVSKASRTGSKASRTGIMCLQTCKTNDPDY